ncbi:S9 family peptidase [Maribacter sp. 2307ULW6-5]|uniref:S9 family peptidase n=1 Tax=Maribacter sp. 2307ULW6-5 TaxID=3386275 RepID=UPI0039BC715A
MSNIIPPKAKKRPKTLETHGHVRQDPYYWLNQRENQEVLDHLWAEKEYYEKMTAHTLQFQEQLFREMKGRIKQDDETVPYKQNGYWYVVKYRAGQEYPIYFRHKDQLSAPEELLFDGNVMAKGHDYFNLGGIAVSPDNALAAFGVDTVSRRQYTLRIKDLVTGSIFPETIKNTSGGAVWANDSKTLFYTKNDTHTLRAHKIYKHVLGTSPKEDEMVYHETDEAFSTFVYKSKSKKYIIIGSVSTLTSEYRILPANDPNGAFQIFSKRQRGLEYDIAHYNDHFYILTNKDGATNFKLMRAGEGNTGADHWEEFIPHRDSVRLEDVDIFKEYYVLSERENGLSRLRIVPWDGSEAYDLPFESETYTAYVGTNPDFDTPILRYVYNSLTTPSSVMDFNMATRQKEVKKEQAVLGGSFKKENYREERIWAPAADGTLIPMSVVRHKDTVPSSGTPLLLYGYGAYGHTIDPHFSSVRLSLMDRGFIYAIAHVRGGEYLGRSWYEQGKLMHKQNTFSDFVDCSRFLISNAYTSPDHLYAMGGSAGGLLVGAVMNMAPDLFKGIVAAVPFVDVLTTMLDDTIPLTTGEYDEWGNPAQKEAYEYMESYSPYDNVKAGSYPHLLVTTGLHDSQVQYFEPAKWVAKLRELKTDNNSLLMDINMDAGHGGASGRFEALREKAKEYAFLLDLEGKIR